MSTAGPRIRLPGIKSTCWDGGLVVRDYTSYVGHPYHVDFRPGSVIRGPPVDLSEPGCYMEGIVKSLSPSDLRLTDATCTYFKDGERL
ncbi:hypothetical protein KIPB_012939, partial [Kipferlia bialata]|eukprot:g12939.t1